MTLQWPTVACVLILALLAAYWRYTDAQRAPRQRVVKSTFPPGPAEGTHEHYALLNEHTEPDLCLLLEDAQGKIGFEVHTTAFNDVPPTYTHGGVVYQHVATRKGRHFYKAGNINA